MRPVTPFMMMPIRLSFILSPSMGRFDPLAIVHAA
jgi:hypothetical protein